MRALEARYARDAGEHQLRLYDFPPKKLAAEAIQTSEGTDL